LETFEQQTGTDEQNETEGDLHEDQGGTQPGAATATDDSSRFGFERTGKIDFSILHGGNEPEQDSGEQTDCGAGEEDAPIDFSREMHGDTGARGKKKHERVATPVSEKNSTGGAKCRENQTFGEKLFEEAAAAGAESETHSHFMATREGANEQEVADVGTGDEQNEKNDDEHDFESGKQRPGVVEGRLPERPQLYATTAVGRGISGFEAVSYSA
jgi:hypothetical protein